MSFTAKSTSATDIPELAAHGYRPASRLVRQRLAAITSVSLVGCSAPSTDPITYNGIVLWCRDQQASFAGSDCDCLAKGLQANLDVTAFSLFGLFVDLYRRNAIYSDGSLSGQPSEADKAAHAQMSLYFHDLLRKNRGGTLSSDLSGLAEDLGKCGGVIAGNPAEFARGFTAEGLMRAFPGAR